MEQMKTKFYWGPGRIQDGKLDDHCGRIILYKDYALVGWNRTMDHNYLMRSFASKFGFKKDEVISHSIRLYFRWEGDVCIIAGRRKIDDVEFENNFKRNAEVVKDALR